MVARSPVLDNMVNNAPNTVKFVTGVSFREPASDRYQGWSGWMCKTARRRTLKKVAALRVEATGKLMQNARMIQ